MPSCLRSPVQRLASGAVPMVHGVLGAHHRGMTQTNEVSEHQAFSGRRTFRRSTSERLIGGVAGGLGEYLDVDPVLVRVGFVALAFAVGFAVPLYLAAWLFVPDEGSDESIGDRLLRRLAGLDDRVSEDA
jgi:phage shock protein PspC (stress-responsive transcriptional regulator)